MRAIELEPNADFAHVVREQRSTAAMREVLARCDISIPPAIDTDELTRAAATGGTLGAAELRAIADALAAAESVHRMLRASQELHVVLAGYSPVRALQQRLVEAIDERGNVLDRASPALRRIRRELSAAQSEARDRVNAILRSRNYAKAIADDFVTIREGRFVIPVKSEFSGTVPGIVHDTSSSGQTLFVEPLAALETNNRLRKLRIDEEREVRRILDELSRSVGAARAHIEANVEMLARADLLAAKAELARAMHATVPELSEKPVIVIERGHHPLLGERAVAQTLAIDDAARLIVISGPNMGGKTVTLKMVGLFVLMTYCGLQVPAACGTVIGRFERVIADIGDEQSVVGNISSYAAHLRRMREMLECAGSRTLALIDEIGSGTEPGAGAALAAAMLERLLERGARGVVTTHATELKLFAHQTPGAVNASVRFDPQTFAPTYELDVGIPGQSLAWALARALGIEEAVIRKAERRMERREQDYETALAELARRTAEVAAEREGLEAQRTASAREAQALESSREELDRQRRNFAAQAEVKLQQALRDFVSELHERAVAGTTRRTKPSAAQAALLARTIDAIHRELGVGSAGAPGDGDAAFAPADRVMVASLNQEGVVAEDYGETVLVSIGAMKAVVKKGDIIRRSPHGEAAARPGRAGGEGEAQLSAASAAAVELDVRGMRYVQAEPLVERWIDGALLGGNSTLRLIHGKGTGLLGRGLQEYLRSHPGVRSVRYGNEDEGSSGVTIIELR